MGSGRHVSNDMDQAGAPSAELVLDLAVIESLRELGGEDEPELVLELVDLFLDDAQQRLERMQRALERGDLAEVARAAHTVKSSAASMGARLLSGLCTEIESMVREARPAGLAERARSCIAAYQATAVALRGVSA